MARKEPKPLTREQQIEQLFVEYQKDPKVCGIANEIPTHLDFKIGDNAEVGQLKGLVVADIRGSLVLLENTQLEEPSEKRSGSNQTKPFIVLHWSEIALHKNIQKTNFSITQAYRINYTNTDLSGVLSSVLRRGINESTDFQRGYVWSIDDKQRLLKSIFEGKEIGKIIFLEDKTYADYRLEILDGKQRIQALLGFINNEFAYEGVYYHQLSRKDRFVIDSQGVQHASLDKNHFSRKELLEIFLNVNDAGVPQTPEHLQYVRDLLDAELDHENDEIMRP